jgi:ligand-binding sensor domain-containing protein
LQVARWDVDGESVRDPSLACATSKGLSLGSRGKLRGLTTVHGLPSNSLYAVLVQGRKTYAGTLGGLAVIEDGRVSRVFKDTNSKLTTNWVTAISAVGSRIFVGTYGGGLFELNAGGELRSFATEVGRVVVNPSAMWSDGSQLFVGTLDGALVFEPATQQWTQVKAELPSRTVLSVTGNDKYVYFGTTGGIARIERSYWDRHGN